MNSSKNTILNTSIEIIYSVLLTIGLLVFFGFILSFYPINHPPIEELKKLFTPFWGVHLYPKPKEHFLYISLLILLPFLLLTSILFVRKLLPEKVKTSLFLWNTIVLIIPLAISFPFLYCRDYINSFVVNFNNTTVFIILSITTIYIFQRSLIELLPFRKTATFWNKLSDLKTQLREYLPIRRQKQLLLFSLFLIASYQIISFRIVNINIISDHDAWTMHLQAVFYAVTQVIEGKTLLSDLPAQYGLYPELLRPVFLLIGLSVFKFTLILGILHLIALMLICITLSKIIKRKLLLFICAMSLFLTTSTTWYILLGATDPLYQFSPIRFIFPAISIFLFPLIAKNPTIKTVSLFSIASGIALIWNLDTGVPIYGSFICYLLSLLIFPSRLVTRFNASKLLALSIILPISIITVFITYLHLKSSSPLNLIDALKYQNIFYITGFGMLPIERGFSQWQVVCAIYIIGLTIPLYGWLKGYRNEKWDFVFFMSILGLGVFSYYEGRSHFMTLIFAAWPAYVISFIVVDHILTLIDTKKLPIIFSLTTYPIVLFGVCLSATFFRGIPTLYLRAEDYWNKILYSTNHQTEITKNIDFIKSQVKGDKEAVILSPLQSIYYGEIGLASPLKGPGHIEILLQADENNLINQLTNNKYKHIFVQLDKNLEIPNQYLFILKNYNIVNKNESIAYLTKM